MHSDVRADVQAHPAVDRQEQQCIIDRWRQEFNHVRPHQALGGKVPAEVYQVGERRRAEVKAYAYPKHFYRGHVSRNGMLSLRGDACRVGQPFAGLTLGIEIVDALRVRLWLHNVDLGILETLPGVDDGCFQPDIIRRMQKTRAKSRPGGALLYRTAAYPLLRATLDLRTLKKPL